jgi:hypothetical protein
MAYLTLSTFNRNLTEAELTSISNYISTEMGSGNTDGITDNVTRTGINANGAAVSLSQRQWISDASASTYLAFLNTFSPAPTYAQVVAPLV